MADNKKEQERDELHRAIWSIADDLRGSVDGWDFKSYPSVWYLDHYGINTEDIFTENNDLGQVLHLLRAGLIQANFAKNKWFSN